MVKNYVVIILLLLMGFVSPQGFAAQDTVSPKAAVEQVLIGPQAGRWQVISIPQAWQTKYWKNSKYQSLYIALRGPHLEDLANFAPCNAPSRLLLGTEDSDGNRNESLLACLHVCSPKDNEKHVYRNLWARNTHLDGITAQLLVNGKIEVVEHYKENLGLERKRLADIGVVEKNRYGDETRQRTHQFSAADLKNASMRKEPASCLTHDASPQD